MKPIVTLTLNPCIDGASETDVVRPTHKIRTSNERYYAGGGGINVARVIAELGGPVLPVYLNGGAIGPLLDRLLGDAGLAVRPVPIANSIRISHAVYERSTGLEYRFVAEGPGRHRCRVRALPGGAGGARLRLARGERQSSAGPRPRVLC